ncbi:hypothetical protein COBT_001356 [Conglomerata obtusa]
MILYNQIKEQRNSITAAVDKYGLISIKNKHKGNTQKFYMLISLLLSSQTKDEITNDAMNNFIKRGVNDMNSLFKLTIVEIKEIISKVGFANKKAIYIKEMSDGYKNKTLPQNYDELIKIKGIGLKMAYLYLNYACDDNQGIGVDTHVLRICQRLGLVVKNADECEKTLQTIFDFLEWKNINYTLVGFGQEICKAIGRKCNICIINKKCPSSNINW